MSHLTRMSVVCHAGQKGLKELPEVSEGSTIVEIEVPGQDAYYLAFSGSSKADGKQEVDTRELLH